MLCATKLPSVSPPLGIIDTVKTVLIVSHFMYFVYIQFSAYTPPSSWVIIWSILNQDTDISSYTCNNVTLKCICTVHSTCLDKCWNLFPWIYNLVLTHACTVQYGHPLIFFQPHPHPPCSSVLPSLISQGYTGATQGQAQAEGVIGGAEGRVSL